MSIARLILIPILFIIGLGIMAIIPVVVSLIYKGSYNRHLNEQLNGEGTARKWISPLALGLIIFLIEVILVVGITVIGVITFSPIRTEGSTYGGVDLSDNHTESWVSGELPDEYAIFDGKDVNDYSMVRSDRDDFSFYTYKFVGEDKIGDADYVIIADYKGDARYNQAISNVSFLVSGTSFTMGTSLDGSDRYYCIIDLDSIVYRDVTVNEDGQTTNEIIVKPKDIEVSYNLDLMYIPDDSDLDSFDFEALTSDTMAAELSIDISDLDF